MAWFLRIENMIELTVDLMSLSYGDVIEVTEVERLTGVSRDDRGFPVALLGLCGELERLLWRIGKRYTLRPKAGKQQCILVLTPDEAVAYTEGRFESGRGKMRRAYRNAAAIDQNLLSPEKKKEHTDQLVKQSRMLQAMRERKKPSLELEPYKPSR